MGNKFFLVDLKITGAYIYIYIKIECPFAYLLDFGNTTNFLIRMVYYSVTDTGILRKKKRYLSASIRSRTTFRLLDRMLYN